VTPGPLAGRRVLVVEDEFLLADDTARELEARGAEVIGPAASVADALALIHAHERLDSAVLDVNLRGEWVYPVADLLVQRGVRFVFATGYDRSAIPPRFAEVTHCEKPVGMARLTRALVG
jgi:CheY-like chemotaxis protein